MSTTTTRADWLETYKRLSKEAEAFRDSQSVAFGLLDEYDKLNSDERIVIHEILKTWLMSDDSSLRYDAEFLVSQRKIGELSGVIDALISDLEKLPSPENWYEVKKLRRMLGELI